MTYAQTSANLLARWLILAAGDAAAFLVFAFIGLANHDMPVTAAVFARTVAPFALSWFILSPLLGAYRQSVARSALRSLWHIPLVWLACGVVALLARMWLFDRPWLVSFAVVSLIGHAILLTGWRVGFALVSQRVGSRRANLAPPQSV